MAKYAIIENEIVINIIEADEDFINENNLEAILENDKTGVAHIGGKYDGKKFLERELTAEEIKAKEDFEAWKNKIETAMAGNGE